MLKELLDRVLELRESGHKEIDGDNYWSEKGKLTAIVPISPVAISVNTLTGLSNYINDNPDALGSSIFVAIQNHTTVLLYDTLLYDDHNARFCYCKANCSPVLPDPGFRFGTYYDIENFIISLQTCFVPGPDVSAILKVVGNLKDSAVKTLADDGVSQTVTIKTGIERVAEASLPNPVKLRPYRTFLEVEQPEGLFILRMKSAVAGGVPGVALFEADGGMWKLEAIQNIKSWLTEKLPEGFIILA